MILARRIVPFVAPVAYVGLYGGLIFQPDRWKYWVALMTVLLITSVAFMVQWKWKSTVFWGTLFPVAMLMIGGTGALTFIRSLPVQIIAALALIVLYALYIEDVFIYRFQQHRYSQLSLPNISFFIGVAGTFAFFAFLFALRLLGTARVWQITIAAVVYGFVFMIHVLWSYQAWKPQYSIYALLVGLCAGELAWVLQFWPTAFYVNGAIMAALLYLLPSLIQMSVRDTLHRASVIRYVALSIALVVIILSTSQWT